MLAGNTYRHLWFVWSGKKVQPGSCHLVIFFWFLFAIHVVVPDQILFCPKGCPGPKPQKSTSFLYLTAADANFMQISTVRSICGIWKATHCRGQIVLMFLGFCWMVRPRDEKNSRHKLFLLRIQVKSRQILHLDVFRWPNASAFRLRHSNAKIFVSEATSQHFCRFQGWRQHLLRGSNHKRRGVNWTLLGAL